MAHLDQEFWDQRWQNEETGWDMGEAQQGLVQLIAKNFKPETQILIPGCGNAHEALALWNLGFKNITLIDIAPTLIAQLQTTLKDTDIQLIHGDFFNHHGQYDLIIEQTFFCAIDPQLRASYVKHMHQLLAPLKGQLIGLMFNIEMPDGPPFGGNVIDYQKLFSTCFETKFEACSFSIPPRAGKEVVIRAYSL